MKCSGKLREYFLNGWHLQSTSEKILKLNSQRLHNKMTFDSFAFVWRQGKKDRGNIAQNWNKRKQI